MIIPKKKFKKSMCCPFCMKKRERKKICFIVCEFVGVALGLLLPLVLWDWLIEKAAH